jgi:hypothetical protein
VALAEVAEADFGYQVTAASHWIGFEIKVSDGATDTLSTPAGFG